MDLSGILSVAIPIFTIVLMEVVLSVDNAAALAIIVRMLPTQEERVKALRYGIIGAYVFRGLALVLASLLIKIAFLKLLGGLYLVWLTYQHFYGAGKESSQEVGVKHGFWTVVMTVEMMDMVFSIDNVFAAVALSPNIYIVMGGVFIGILAMRFAAGGFVKLLEKYPQMESSAFLVIGILGLKLSLSYLFNVLGFHGLEKIVESHAASMISSAITLALFIYPVTKKFYEEHSRSDFRGSPRE